MSTMAMKGVITKSSYNDPMQQSSKPAKDIKSVFWEGYFLHVRLACWADIQYSALTWCIFAW